VASILRSYGFNVVSVGNADNFDYDETKVLAPKANQDVQTELLKSMRVAGIESKGYTSDQIPDESDVLVIIGKTLECRDRSISVGTLTRRESRKNRSKWEVWFL